MTTKYGIANALIDDLNTRAADAAIEPGDAMEATLIMLIQAFKESRGADYARGILQYELDSLGSGGTFDIARGGGHS